MKQFHPLIHSCCFSDCFDYSFEASESMSFCSLESIQISINSTPFLVQIVTTRIQGFELLQQLQLLVIYTYFNRIRSNFSSSTFDYHLIKCSACFCVSLSLSITIATMWGIFLYDGLNPSGDACFGTVFIPLTTTASVNKNVNISSLLFVGTN